MAVITKYVVVRNGVELDIEFLVKKEAEAYDKMLDAADNLANFIKESDLEIDLDDKKIDEISVFLAKNGPEVIGILKGIKPAAPPESSEQVKPVKPVKKEPEPEKKKAVARKPKPKKK
jgi:hypothetical protein